MPDVFLFEIYGYDDALAEFWQKKRPPEGDPNHTKQQFRALFALHLTDYALSFTESLLRPYLQGVFTAMW